MAKEKVLPCDKCGKETANSYDYYMVKNELWNKHNGGHRILCINCFEGQLGRVLEKDDLLASNPPINLCNPYTAALINDPQLVRDNYLMHPYLF